MGVHAFVAMPYGVKEGIDFNLVYTDLIKPALESAGLEVFRADEELGAGDSAGGTLAGVPETARPVSESGKSPGFTS